MLSAGQLSGENLESITPPTRPQSQSIATQTNLDLSDASAPEPPLPPPPPPKPEVVTYSKAVQTDPWVQPTSQPADGASASEDEDSPTTSRANKRLSRREREKDDEIRESLRREIEEELNAAKELQDGGGASSATQSRYPLRTLSDDELNAVTSAGDFLDFVEHSSKVIERALDEDYDVLADYGLGGLRAEEDEDEDYAAGKKRDIKEVHHFWDERWSKKRMISDISFSPKVRYSSSCR